MINLAKDKKAKPQKQETYVKKKEPKKKEKHYSEGRTFKNVAIGVFYLSLISLVIYLLIVVPLIFGSIQNMLDIMEQKVEEWDLPSASLVNILVFIILL